MQKTLTSPHSQAIAQKLVAIRERAGLKQRGLAKLLGREHSFVANCELGQRRVDLAEFYWICEACGASPQKEAASLFKAFKEL